MADDISNSSSEMSLCSLMMRLKVENPDLGRKEMHSAVLAEGPSWEKVTFAEVDKTWRKMKKKNAKSNKENMHKAENSSHKNESGTTGEKKEELGACGGEGLPCKDLSNNSKSNKKGKSQSSEHKEVTSEELARALFKEKTVLANGNKSKALEKQLKMLQENPYVNYVVFTPPSESNDCAIQLADPMGEIFFNIMWNRVVKAPFGSKSVSRELFMIYQQLEFNLLPKYKKMLRMQLQEEFGVDPLEGQVQK